MVLFQCGTVRARTISAHWPLGAVLFHASHRLVSPLPSSHRSLHASSATPCAIVRSAPDAPVARSSVYGAAIHATRPLIVLDAMWQSRPDYANTA